MSVEKSMPQPRVFVESAEVPMSYENHSEVRQQILEAAREYTWFQTPDVFDVTATGVNLRGSMPDNSVRLLGDGYNHLSFHASHDMNSMPADADVSLTLHGVQPAHQIHIDSDKLTVVDFGWNKPFIVTPHEREPIAVIDCGDVATMLDEIIPDRTRRFEKLVDPRKAQTFGRLALEMGDNLKGLAKTSKTSRSFTHKQASSRQETESGVKLTIDELNGVPSYTLSMTAPLDTWSKRVIEHFSYSFLLKPHTGPGKDMQPLESNVKVQLMSQEMSSSDLQRSLSHIQSSIDGYDVCMRALTLLARKFK